MEAMTATEWVLSPAEFAATVERAAKINTRAAKRGFTGRVEVTGTQREVTETDAAGLSRTRLVVDTQIAGEAPRYNGWEFLAAVDTVETEDGADFVLRTAPGVEESNVDRSSLVPGRCQHCNTVRRNRRYTYLVRNTEGETAQVGSTCLKDFLGWEGKPVFIFADEAEDELREFAGGLVGSAAEYSAETVVAAAWGVSRLYGWVPVSAAGYGQRSTREAVSAYLYGNSREDRELQAEVAPEMAAAQTKAQEIIAALLAGLEGNGDYVTNLKILLKARNVEGKHLGIVVSAVGAYERMLGQQVERKAREEKVTEFVGAVGEKLTFTGTVAHLTPVESDWGTSMLVTVEDGKHVFKMFTSAAWAWEVEQGQQVTVKATVKLHEAYKGVNQTQVVRPKKVS